MRRPKRSDPPHNTYLPIEDCGKAVQRLPLERIKSLSEALDQYRIRYNRDLMAAVFGSSEAFYELVITELRSFDPGLDVAGARKSYCEAALKDIPRNSPRARWAEPYCKDPE